MRLNSIIATWKQNNNFALLPQKKAARFGGLSIA
jgi:hypothetical protein